jgi:quinone-modifying oxidoreductase subunit QmoC
MLLVLTAWARAPLETFTGGAYTTNRIIISYWSQLPQWLLIAFFAPFVFLEAVVMSLGVMRFWRDLKARDRETGFLGERRSLAASIRSAARSILLHEEFDRCTAERPRMNSHRLVLFGFAGLLAVDLWVLTARFNPLLRETFVYPFNFWSPWKILANLAGAAMLIGCTLMVRDRLARAGRSGALPVGTWFDWVFLALALAAVLTGFGCEILHYLRVDPLRYAAYVIHLSTVFALLVLLPYSKFAHMIYRATAMVYAAHTGRPPQGGVRDSE